MLVSVGALIGIGTLGELFTSGLRTGLVTPVIVGLVLSVQLAAIWLLVLQRTLRGVWHGELFQAPCLGGPQSAAHGVFSAD